MVLNSYGNPTQVHRTKEGALDAIRDAAAQEDFGWSFKSVPYFEDIAHA